MKKKNIAIMTWYTYNNYGSVLQAYSLQKVIKNLGYNADTINFLPKVQNLNLKEKVKFENIKKRLLQEKKNIKNSINEKDIKFQDFRTKEMSFTPKCNNVTDLFLLNDVYDKFICGSDQIWAPTVFDENYFLSFVTDKSKKIAYAPSIGLPTIENLSIKENIKKLINEFSSLSIREEQGKKILQELTTKEISVVLDPTLLLTKEEWNEQFSLKEYNNDDYIVFYCLKNNKKQYSTAKKIAKKLNKQLKIIPGNIEDYQKKETINASPEEFLKLIYNAYMVITDSFHGTIFAINFNVPFLTFKRFKDDKLSQNSRIYNILRKTNLEGRLYNDNLNYFINNVKLNFNEANKILDIERKKSMNFLKYSIQLPNIRENQKKITNLCTGCGMCSVVCPTKAISLKLNKNGFYYYDINNSKCINCNQCIMVCGQLRKNMDSIKNMKLYSAYSLDENVLKKSSSGGVAYELSRYAIEHNLQVVGCTYDLKNNKAKHIIVDNINELDKLSGSKYLQSDTVEAFKKMKKMKSGLVIGTPCQINSIDRYLKNANKRSEFILVDLVCHGVPTYFLWNKYISQFPEIDSVIFRNKKYGWEKKYISINKKYNKPDNKDLFYSFFENSIAYNDACYNCKYRIETNADLRIGDYWGKRHKKNNNGISMIICNTNRGQQIINQLSCKRIKLEKENIDDYFNFQQINNIPIPINNEQIINELKSNENNLKKISNKYCKKITKNKKAEKIIIHIYNRIKGKRNG